MLHRSWILVILMCCGPSVVAAQATASSPNAPRWGAWGGIARNSPDNIWGAEPGRDVELVAIRLTWSLARSRTLALDYVLDAIPAARVSMVRDGSSPPFCSEAKPGERCLKRPVITDTRPVLGLGLAPVGIQVRFRSAAHVQSYVDLSGGVLRFARDMPMDGAARFNYTAEVGAGVMIGAADRLGVTLGYKFYHISNGGTGVYNPGLDNHMLVVGVQQIMRF